MNVMDYGLLLGKDATNWQVLKGYLLEVKESKIGLLVASTDHDESNRIRGAISLENQLLALEDAARNTPGR